MKKFLLVLAFVLGAFASEAQTSVQQKWTGENLNQWGSFYWKVDRSTNTDAHGKYWYYIYFYSNSLLNQDKNLDGNLDKAITSISDVYVTMYEYNANSVLTNKVPVNVSHVSCDYHLDKNVYKVYFWSYSPLNRFGITYSKVSAWSESRYQNGK